MTNRSYFFVFILACIFHGLAEATIYEPTGGYRGGNIWYQIGTVAMFIVFAIPILTKDWKFIYRAPAIAFVQDNSFYLFSPKMRDPESWVNFGLSGLWVNDVWIPTTYFIGGLFLIYYIYEPLIRRRAY